MPSSNAIAPPPSTAHFQLSTVNSRLFCPNSFRITYIRKNASANPYGSHTSKTKDLKPFRITYLQKKGVGYPCFPLSAASRSDRSRLSTLNCRLSTHGGSFTSPPSSTSFASSQRVTNHESRVTAFPQRVYHKHKARPM